MAKVLDRIWSDRLGSPAVDKLILGLGLAMLLVGVAGTLALPMIAAPV